MERRELLAILGTASAAGMAGCTSTSSPRENQSGDSASGDSNNTVPEGPIGSIEIDVVDGTRSFVVKYELDEYATVLLETADGTIIQEETASPDGDEVTLAFEDMRGGEYEFVIRRDGETLASTAQSYSGPETTITSLSALWERNRLTSLQASFGNDGDMPTRLDAAKVTPEQKGEALFGLNAFVLPSDIETLEFDLANEYLDFETAGDITTTLAVETGSKVIEDTTTHELQSGTPEFERIEPLWGGYYLSAVEFELRNTGDIQREMYIEVSHEQGSIETREFIIFPGETTTVQARGGVGDRLYEDDANEYPTIELDIVGYSTAGEELISTTVATSRPEV